MLHISVKRKEVSSLIDKFLQESKLPSEGVVDVDLNEEEIVIRLPKKKAVAQTQEKRSKKGEIMKFAGIWGDFTEEEDQVFKEIMKERSRFGSNRKEFRL